MLTRTYIALCPFNPRIHKAGALSLEPHLNACWPGRVSSLLGCPGCWCWCWVLWAGKLSLFRALHLPPLYASASGGISLSPSPQEHSVSSPLSLGFWTTKYRKRSALALGSLCFRPLKRPLLGSCFLQDETKKKTRISVNYPTSFERSDHRELVGSWVCVQRVLQLQKMSAINGRPRAKDLGHAATRSGFALSREPSVAFESS